MRIASGIGGKVLGLGKLVVAVISPRSRARAEMYEQAYELGQQCCSEHRWDEAIG